MYESPDWCNPSHLSAGENEDESGSSCGEAPGEQGPQQGLNHRTDTCNHDACANQTQRDGGRSLFLTDGCVNQILFIQDICKHWALCIKQAHLKPLCLVTGRIKVQLMTSSAYVVYNYCLISATCVILEHKRSHKQHGYICSNSQQYIVWVKIIHFSFMPKIIRLLIKDHVPWRYFVYFLP